MPSIISNPVLPVPLAKTASPNEMLSIMNQLINAVNSPVSDSPINYMQVPAGAAALFSVVQPLGYTGPCLRVQRSSDNTQLDIGWSPQNVNGNLWSVVDWPTADAFAAGSTLTVVTWYDLSGNGANAVSGTNAPQFSPYSNFNSCRPITFNGLGSSAAPVRYNLDAPVSVTTSQFTLYMVAAPRNMWWQYSFGGLQSAPGGTDVATTYGSRSVVSPLSIWNNAAGQHIGATGTNAAKFLPSSYCNLSISGGGAAQLNTNQFTITPLVSQTAANLCIGAASSTGPVTGYDFTGDMFVVALYPANHTQVQQTQYNLALSAPLQPSYKKYINLVYGGSSLIASYNQTFARTTPWQAGFGRLPSEDSNGYFLHPSRPNVNITNMGYPGQTLALEYADYTDYAASLYNSSAQQNIYVMDAPSNDISAATYTSQANAYAGAATIFTGTTLPYINALMLAGWNNIIVPTIIPRTGFVSGSGNYYEDARLYYNWLVRTSLTNATPALNQAAFTGGTNMTVPDGGTAYITNGYRCSDRANIPQFATSSASLNTAVFSSDNIHPNDLGYNLIAGCDLREIFTFV
jgi:hypothetical protein